MAEERAERVQEFYFSPTLIIGLGGTGQKVVRRVKGKLREAYGDVPIIRYLVVDTSDMSNEPGEEPLEDYERVEMRGFNVNEVVENLDRFPAVKAWWPGGPDLKPGYIWHGTRQMRCVGRLAFFMRYSEFLEKLQEATGALLEIENYTRTEEMSTPLRRYIVERERAKVFIIFSICGGTGSGIFLDVAYLCRHLLAERNPMINGMIVLPPVLDTLIESPIIMRKTRASAYASLKELDYFITNPRWVCTYPDGTSVQISSHPFDFTYLIDLGNQRGEHLNSLDDICEMIANAIFLSTGLSTAREMESRDEIERVRSLQINRKFRAYSSLATTSLLFPKQKVLDYCSARMAEALIKDGFLQGSEESRVKLKKGDVEQAISAFLSEARLRDNDVVAELRRGREVVIAWERAIREARDMTTALRLLVAQESDNRNQRQEQADLIKGRAESLQDEAKEALRSKVVEVVKGRGIHFATLFLEELTAQPPLGKVDRAATSLVGLKRRIEGKVGSSERALAEAERSYSEAKARLKALEAKRWWVIKFILKLLFIWRRTLRRHTLSCITYMREANERFLDLEAQRRARNLYNALNEEAKRLHSSLAQVRQRLKVAASSLSAEAKEELMPPSPKEGIYELAKEVVDADYIQRYYEEKVAPIDIPTAFREFTKGLPDVKVAQLEMRSEKEYARLLKEHASGYFREGLERIRVLDILSEGPPEEVQRRVEEQFRDLLRYCEPFWWYDRTGIGQQPEPIPIEIIGVEDKGDPRIPERYQTMAITTGLRHRIDAVKFLHGVPAFLIWGMRVYKSCYEEERRGIDPQHISRGWERFEDIFPEVEKWG
jgi:hypothetical protein